MPTDKIVISTGGIPDKHSVIDTVFAIASGDDGWFGNDPSRAFDGVKEKLREQCKDLGGQAVINCEFEYRVAVSTNPLFAKQVVEIFAYGTAVKLT